MGGSKELMRILNFLESSGDLLQAKRKEANINHHGVDW
jgi:hypothetical protein